MYPKTGFNWESMLSGKSHGEPNVSNVGSFHAKLSKSDGLQTASATSVTNSIVLDGRFMGADL